jgi:hypothetical protein
MNRDHGVPLRGAASWRLPAEAVDQPRLAHELRTRLVEPHHGPCCR